VRLGVFFEIELLPAETAFELLFSFFHLIYLGQPTIAISLDLGSETTERADKNGDRQQTPSVDTMRVSTPKGNGSNGATPGT
jgi:hypothetical protein